MKRRVLMLCVALFALAFVVYGAQAAEKKKGANALKGTVQDASGQMPVGGLEAVRLQHLHLPEQPLLEPP